MKRSSALTISLLPVGLAAAAILTAGPAQAATFANCSQARAAGQTNIPRSSPNYSRNLDRDNDGVACESGSGESSSGSSSSSSSGSGSGSADSTSSSGAASSGNSASGSTSINSGSGGQADAIPGALPAALGGVGLFVVAGSAIAIRRRTAVLHR